MGRGDVKGKGGDVNGKRRCKMEGEIRKRKG